MGTDSPPPGADFLRLPGPRSPLQRGEDPAGRRPCSAGPPSSCPAPGPRRSSQERGIGSRPGRSRSWGVSLLTGAGAPQLCNTRLGPSSGVGGAQRRLGFLGEREGKPRGVYSVRDGAASWPSSSRREACPLQRHTWTALGRAFAKAEQEVSALRSGCRTEACASCRVTRSQGLVHREVRGDQSQGREDGSGEMAVRGDPWAIRRGAQVRCPGRLPPAGV